MHCQDLTKFRCAGVRAGADKGLLADSLPLVRGLLLAFGTTVPTGELCNACLCGPAIHGRIYDPHPAEVGSASRRADNRPRPNHRDHRGNQKGPAIMTCSKLEKVYCCIRRGGDRNQRDQRCLRAEAVRITSQREG